MELKLYEEVMLLALRDDKGTVTSSFTEYALAGAVMAELILAKRITVDSSKKKMVSLINAKPMSDDVLDRAMSKIKGSKRKVSLANWVTKIAGMKRLRLDIAYQLCDKGVLKAQQERVLLIFNREVFPEINPEPEQKILQRIEAAITGNDKTLPPKTAVLVSLCNGAGLLKDNIDAQILKDNKQRIEQISKGECIGDATKEIIVACQTAIFIAAIMPTVITTVVATG